MTTEKPKVDRVYVEIRDAEKRHPRECFPVYNATPQQVRDALQRAMGMGRARSRRERSSAA